MLTVNRRNRSACCQRRLRGWDRGAIAVTAGRTKLARQPEDFAAAKLRSCDFQSKRYAI
jgi:hypothetical protein